MDHPARDNRDADEAAPPSARAKTPAVGPLGAIGVILSGTERDGAEGLEAVSAAGGYTLVQAPGDVKHSDMPRAAIARGTYDKVRLAREIRDYVDNFERLERLERQRREDW